MGLEVICLSETLKILQRENDVTDTWYSQAVSSQGTNQA